MSQSRRSIYYYKIAAITAIAATFAIDSLAGSKTNEALFKVNEKHDHLNYIIFIILTFIATFAATMQLLKYEFNKRIKSLDKEQTDKLVNSFNQMSRTIDERDATLKSKVQAAENKNDLFVNVSHELRTPMHAILSIAEIGQSKYNQLKPEQIKDYFSRIESSAERLMVLADNILDLSKLEAGEAAFNFQKNDIEKCIQNSIAEIKQLSDEKNINIILDIKTSSKEFIFDYNKILQVMINLLSNSIKFSDNGEDILITVSNSKFNDHESKTQEGILISVKDKGIGIPIEDISNIFNKFSQCSNNEQSIGGSGIGLAICREIVSFHNGVIWASQEATNGAELIFAINKNITKS